MVLVLILAALPAHAKHDDFLFGEAPNIRTWDQDQPGEGSIARTALMRAQAETIASLYLAPIILGKTDGLSKAQLKKRATEALAFLPAVEVMVQIDPGAPPATKKARKIKARPGVCKISETLNESLTFLRWRLNFFCVEPQTLKNQIANYLAKRNELAKKQGTLLCGDLIALSLDYERQGRYLDQENLAQLSHRMITTSVAEVSGAIDLEAVKKYEENVARAYAMAQLDRREEAANHYSDAINYLRIRPVAQRPQTDGLRKSLLRVLDQDLLAYDGDEKKVTSASERALLKKNIGYLIDIAYLAKLDGRLSEAAHLFRRAYLLLKRHLPEQLKDYSSLTYDLGETLFWDEKFDDAIYYLGLSAKARAEAQPDSVVAVDTNNLLGRILLGGGQANKAKAVFFDDLRSVAIRSKLQLSGSEHDAVIADLSAYYKSAGSDERRQIDDALQGVVDAALPLKQYDLALTAGEALLSVRSQAQPPVDASMMSVLWGLAYTCDSCAKPETAIKYYTRMIDSYGATTPTSLAYWYHGRGIDYDLIGRSDPAKKDINRAIALYQEKREAEEDDEARDHLHWTIADLQYNLKMAAKYSVKHPDYADLPDNCRWRLSSFPLRVFVDTARDRGFGGELNKLVHEAVSIWTDYQGSPVKIEYVDKMSDADIFIERVTVYDDIPYGSAGRTSANYEKKGEADTKILTRTHVRVYCPSYDGSDWERQDVKMSSFAKIQLKYLLVHELGHVLGLAHSPSGPDIMYWKSCAQSLTPRDMDTVKHIYQLQRVNLPKARNR